MDYFAISALRRNVPERVIPILDYWKKFAVAVNTDSWIFAGIRLGNFECRVFAAIVDNDVLKMRVSLTQNALDTLRKVFRPVVDRSNDADQRRRINTHGFGTRLVANAQSVLGCVALRARS